MTYCYQTGDPLPTSLEDGTELTSVVWGERSKEFIVRLPSEHRKGQYQTRIFDAFGRHIFRKLPSLSFEAPKSEEYESWFKE